jgi:hypothetical protein
MLAKDEMKAMKPLKKEQKRDISSLAKMKDSDIDLTDMPEVLDWSNAEIGKFYRGGKQIVPVIKKSGGKKKS